LKTLFNIQGEAAEKPEMLLLEIGADHVKFALYSRENDSFSHIRIYETAGTMEPHDLSAILQELGHRNISKVIACSSFPQALLLPRFKTNDYAELWKSIFGEPATQVLKDDVPEWQIANVYALPPAIQQQIQSSFPAVHFMHNFSCALKNYNGYDDANQVSIDFSTRHFRVIVKKEGAIQLAQIYAYQRPLDVVYYLLKINSEMGFDQSKILLVLSGLIEENSAMFKLLHEYFSNIVFAKPGKAIIPQNELPSHFFASIKNLAACAS
jgi:hypothetical protein